MTDEKEKKVNLTDLALNEMEEWFARELNQPAFRARQVWEWIWRKLARDFDSMSDVSKKLRDALKEKAEIVWPQEVATRKSADGTVKLLLEFADGARAETVLIPSPGRSGETRWSQCLSTQIGCGMGCVFCATGKMGFSRNMTSGEILSQILVGREFLNDMRPDWPVLRNLVFMGMGEPLLNLENLMKALQELGHDRGLNFSPRRITVSTCGIEKGLKTLGESGLAFLAVSLHAPTQELRKEIMPKAATWELDKMLKALAEYPLKARERITFEYLLLGGVNDSLEDARKLASIVSRTKSKLNVIVYNPVSGAPFKAPSESSVEAFLSYLRSRNITAILRKSKGADIAGACGQLQAASARG